MKRKVLIGLLALVLILVGFEAGSKSAQSELREYRLTLEAFRELNRVGPGFYSITSQEISQFIWFLAGPECEGRRSGTEGNRRAGEFLMKELESYFLEQHFFQDFSFSEIKNPRDHSTIADYLRRIGFEVSENGRNVMGILAGTDKKEEYVVICAHYDHIGVQKGELFPGADDNASGTAAVLEIAEAFGILTQEGIRPSRSVIFAFFDAEEMGLWGSQYFVQNSPVPFESIVAVINLDMIGRNEPKELQVMGSKNIEDFSERSPQLYWATIKANKILGFELVYPPAWADSHQEYVFFLSDQVSFFLASPKESPLPVVFYHSGLHQDYHTPLDTADKINFEKVQNAARFTFFVAWLLSNLEERPIYQNEEEK